MRPVHLLGPLLLLIALLGCSDRPAAQCGVNTRAGPGGLCRVVCSVTDMCLVGEVCTDGLCLPPSTASFEIRRFELEVASVPPGGTIPVEYAVVGADRIELHDFSMVSGIEVLVTTLDIPIGRYSVTDRQTSGLLILRAFKDGRQPIEQRLMYTVDTDAPQPQIIRFTASPSEVELGAPFIIEWETRDASVVRLTRDGQTAIDDAGVSGGATFTTQANTTFELIAGNGVTDIRTTISVVVRATEPPIIDFFIANADQIQPGDSLALIWSTSKADRVVVEFNGTPIYETTASDRVTQGAWIVAPAVTTTYRLHAHNDLVMKETTSAVTVTVRRPPPLPTIMGAAVTPNVAPGASTTARVTWGHTPSNAAVEVVDLSTGEVLVTSGQSAETTIEGGAHNYLVTAENETGADTEVVSVLVPTTEVEPNDVPGSLQPQDVSNVQLSAMLAGRIATGWESDYFAVDRLSHGFVRIEAVSPCISNMTLSLRDRNNAEVARSIPSVTGCATLHAMALPAAYYELQVTASGPTTNEVQVPYTLRVEAVDLAVCGNGIPEFGEFCDDSNQENGDGCSAFCQREPMLTYTVLELQSVTPPPQGGTSINFEPSGDLSALDDGFFVLPLPFAFPFYGNQHWALVVHTNGYVGFLPDFTQTRATLTAPLGASLPNAIIAAVAADLFIDSNGGPASVEVKPVTAPSGAAGVAIHYRGLRFEEGPEGSVDASIRIFENGDVIIAYHDIITPTEVMFGAGIEDHRATSSTLVPGCRPMCVSDEDFLTRRSFRFEPAVGMDPL